MFPNIFVHNVIGANSVMDDGWTPHSPVGLYLQGKPKVTRVRTLRAPFKLPAVLPHGPPTLSATEMDVILDLHCAQTSGMRVMQAVEQDLHELVGHQPTDGEISRLDGPQVVLKPPQMQTTVLAGEVSTTWQGLADSQLLASYVHGVSKGWETDVSSDEVAVC